MFIIHGMKHKHSGNFVAVVHLNTTVKMTTFLVILLPIKCDPLNPFKRLKERSLLQHTDSCPEESKPTAF